VDCLVTPDLAAPAYRATAVLVDYLVTQAFRVYLVTAVFLDTVAFQVTLDILVSQVIAAIPDLVYPVTLDFQGRLVGLVFLAYLDTVVSVVAALVVTQGSPALVATPDLVD
jgi:uncharacterized membrane protein